MILPYGKLLSSSRNTVACKRLCRLIRRIRLIDGFRKSFDLFTHDAFQIRVLVCRLDVAIKRADTK